MKTLEQIKDEASNNLLGSNFFVAVSTYSAIHMNELINDVAKQYAQQACEDLRGRIAESALLLDTSTSGLEVLSSFEYEYGHVTIDKDSILNTEIILP